MRPIRRVVRAEYVQSVIDGKLHFSPCKTFVDLLEFRFGYCWDAFEIAREKRDPEIFNDSIRRSFSNKQVQERINEAVISCWSYNPESPWMWEVYGRSEAAIMLTAESEKLSHYVKEQWDDAALAGPVRYDFAISSIHPEFIGITDNPRWKDDYHLFFHKHKFYGFEQEFRAVIFGQLSPVELDLPDGIITGVTLPPSQLPSLQPAVIRSLEKRFGNMVRPSTLSWSSKPQNNSTIDDYLLDEKMPKTDEILQLAEKWKRLQQQMTGWNDPKAPPIGNISELMVQSKEVEEQLKRAIKENERPQNEGG